MYQARACGFEVELTAAEGEGLSVGADVFYVGNNVDPMRLRNVHVAWMTLINNSRGIALETVQSSEAPNDTIERREQYTYFVYRTRLTGKWENDATREGRTLSNSRWKFTG